MRPCTVCSPPYNLFERAIEQDTLRYCREHGIATITYGGLCRGLLSGKMREDTEFTGDDLRKNDPKFQGERYRHYLQAVAELDAFAQERYQKNVLALALRWLIDQPGVTTALWGVRRPEQLDPVGDIEGWSLGSARPSRFLLHQVRCKTGALADALESADQEVVN